MPFVFFPMREIAAWRNILPQLLELHGDHSLSLPTQFKESGEADYSAMPDILNSIGAQLPAGHTSPSVAKRILNCSLNVI